jgi:hypothetical protein
MARRLLHFPDMRHVPDYSVLERACRYAGETPKSHKNRAHQHRAVMRRVAEVLRKGRFHARELRIFGDYRDGKFDLKGRPRKDDLDQLDRLLSRVAQKVEEIQREQQLHRDAAVRVFLETHPGEMSVIENGVTRWVSSDDDPEDEVFSYLKNYLKR